MKKMIGVLCGAVLLALIWITWDYQPWMRTGKTVRLSETHLGDYDFEVWQRKNSGSTEPFTTWLFARKRGEKWMPYMLDFEDIYRPSIVLRREATGIGIFRGSTRPGIFDVGKRTFKRTENGMVVTSVEVDYDPRGN